MAAADLTVRNGVGVAAEAILHPLDWRSSVRTRAATCRTLACEALATEPLEVRLARLLVRVVHLPICTEPAAGAVTCLGMRRLLVARETYTGV